MSSRLAVRFRRFCLGFIPLSLALTGCAIVGWSGYPSLVEGMSPGEVQTLWGAPTRVLEYDDSSGHHVRWEYYRSHVGEEGYWSLEPQQTGYGYTTTAVRRGRPYTQRYLAAWAVFTDGRTIRWQTYDPPADAPTWMRSDRGLHSRSSWLTYP